MTGNLRRLVVQGSGMAFAAVVSTAMPAAHPVTAAQPSLVQTGASAVSPAGNRRAAHFVGFAADESISADIRHRWP